jgi:hypothetical protein
MNTKYNKKWEGNNSLFKEWLIPYAIKEFDIYLSEQIDFLSKTQYEDVHPGHKFDRVISRLKLIELLHSDEVFDQFSEASTGNTTSLRIYLTSTIFEMLGKTNKTFLSFISWLEVTKSIYTDTIQKRKNKIDELLKEEIDDENKLIKSIKSLNEEYKKVHGMRNAFQNFFSNILDETTKSEIIDHLWLAENETWPSGSLAYIHNKPLVWGELSFDEKIKQIAKVIEQTCRNNYTHNGIQIFDSTDSKINNTQLRIAKIIMENKNPQMRHYDNESKDEFNKILNYTGSVIRLANGCTIKLTGDKTIHVQSKSPSDWSDIYLEIIETNTSLSLIKPRGLIYYKDMKKVLCFEGVSFTKFLFKIAMRGFTNKIITVAQEKK